MSGSNRTKLSKLPFYGADLVLSFLAGYGLYTLGDIVGAWEGVVAAACIAGGAWGAWLAVVPWLREYETSARLAESSDLTTAVAQIQNLENVAATIQQANSQWQLVQDSASRTVQAAQEISVRMKRETDEFMKFLDQANEQEKAALRLEVQKSRKLEDDWLSVSVRMLDHVYALYSAAARSGQQHLTSQLEQFQLACRDAARRVGLSPFVPNKNEPFDARAHQSADQKIALPDGAVVTEVLATGYTYQGQLLRRALVRAAAPEVEVAAPPPISPSSPAPDPEAEFNPVDIEEPPAEQQQTEPAEPSASESPAESAEAFAESSASEEFLETEPLPDSAESPKPLEPPPASQPQKPARPVHPQLPLE